MEKVKHISKKLYNHSFVRYIVIGGTTFAIDFLLLVIFRSGFGVGLVLATTIGYWVSIAFNFLANRFWTFGTTTETHIMKHVSAYLLLLGFNYLFTVLFMAGATTAGIHYTIAKILAVAIQISWTYYAYKHYVFK